MTLPHNWRFEAIGTAWQIDTPRPLGADLEAAILDRIAAFDLAYSRFRDDSLVARIARTPGRHEFPDDAADLFALYRRLYDATDGAMSPLVGAALDRLGYDKAYSLRASGPAIPAPSWDDAVAWDGRALTTLRPVSVDVGAAGKGYLVDLVGAMLERAGVDEFIVDGSGDILHRGDEAIRVALEHPWDATKAIGVASIAGGAICASASNRRAWGDGLHHVLDATTGLPTRGVIATWAIAASALEADGLATALFFAAPARLAEQFEFDFVRMHSTGQVESSPNLDGELFT